MADRDPGSPATILRTLDPALLAVAKSLLEAAHIPFFAKGEALRMARGGGPIELQVPRERIIEAKALLADLESS
jgi:hypothetical protein